MNYILSPRAHTTITCDKQGLSVWCISRCLPNAADLTLYSGSDEEAILKATARYVREVKDPEAGRRHSFFFWRSG